MSSERKDNTAKIGSFQRKLNWYKANAIEHEANSIEHEANAINLNRKSTF